MGEWSRPKNLINLSTKMEINGDYNNKNSTQGTLLNFYNYNIKF
jgi:hypothetical protein